MSLDVPRVRHMTATKDETSPWMTVAEAAVYLRRSKRHVQRLVANGELKSSLLGARARITKRDWCDEYAEANATGGAKAARAAAAEARAQSRPATRPRSPRSPQQRRTKPAA